MTPRRLAALIVVGVLGLALAAVAVPPVLDLAACGAAERRVLAEFPHHGGASPRISGNADLQRRPWRSEAGPSSRPR